MEIALIEAPICKGSPTDGTQYAYRALTENGISACFSQNVRLMPMNNPAFDEDEGAPNMKYLGEVMAVSSELCRTVKEALSSGCFPITLGGDHSIAMGTVAGASSLVGTEAISVIYIDGHADINTEGSTVTGLIHGMPLAAAMGLCSDRLTVGRKQNILGKNIYIIGARSIDDGEYPIIAENGVHLYTADDVRCRGINNIMSEVMASVGKNKVHISFDVDFLDTEVFSSTGYRMPNGLDLAVLDTILSSAFSFCDVVSMDAVEYNPTLDKDGRDMEKLFKIFRSVSEHLKRR